MNYQKDEKRERKHTAQELNRLRRGRVGEDVPDESKERHTEIAVEAGRKVSERKDDKP
jgi:hypothetical protein